MKIRSMKRMFYRVMARRRSSPWPWRSEDRGWDNIAPVGREFGSPDFDRLMELDDAAFAAFGSIERVRQWLDAPNDQLDGMCPEDAARRPGLWLKVIGLLKEVA